MSAQLNGDGKPTAALTQIDEQAAAREASQLGWIPLEKFKGDPDKWIPAAEYLQRGRDFIPFLRATNARQSAEIAKLSTELAGVKSAQSESADAMEAFRKYHESTAMREYERARKELTDKKVEALTDLKDGTGDPSAIIKIDDAITALDAAKPQPKPESDKPKPPEENPEYKAWATDNPWLADPGKSQFAAAVSQYLRVQNPTVVGRAFLDLVTEAVEEKFGPQTPGGKTLESGTRNPRGGGSADGRGYSDLPADARAACDKLAARLVGPNKVYKNQDAWRKAYCKDYDWS